MSTARGKRIWRSSALRHAIELKVLERSYAAPSGLLHGASPHTPTADSSHRNFIIVMIAQAVQLFQQSLSLVSTLRGQAQDRRLMMLVFWWLR